VIGCINFVFQLFKKVYFFLKFQFNSSIYNFDLIYFFYFKFWLNLDSLFFKMIKFCVLQFKTKLVIKLNYNLYIHVKINLEFIHKIT